MDKKVKPRFYWTKERVQEVVLKCKSRGELNDLYGGAYNSGLKNGWLDEVCSHMVNDYIPKVYWTKEKVKEVALKCKSRSEFQKLYGSAYQATFKNGWVNEVFSHMERKYLFKKSVSVWTLDLVREVALKCKSRSELNDLYSGAYHAALRNGWIDEVCSHMEKQINKKPRYIYAFIWEDKKLVYVGLTINYKRREKQHINNKRKGIVAKTIVKYGKPIFKVITEEPIDVNLASEYEQKWIDNYIELGYTPVNIAKAGGLGGYSKMWEFEKVKEVALKCKTRLELFRSYPGAYNSAIKNGWVDEVCSHMEGKIQWNFEKVKEVALKCKTRLELFRSYPGAYGFAYKNGWLDEVCSHTPKQNVSVSIGHWKNKENVKMVALKCNSKGEFQKLYGSAYTAAYRNGWIDEVCSHMKKKEIQWNFKSVKKVALKCKTRSEFNKLYRSAYNSAYNNGWLDEVCSHIPNNQKPNGYWTKEKVKEAVLKCESRGEFSKLYKGAYDSAHRNGWLDEVCSHMKKKEIQWNFKSVKKVALKCKTRSEFQKLYGSAYNSAHRNGWLDEVCSHMVKR